jgi:hypothetical protein
MDGPRLSQQRLGTSRVAAATDRFCPVVQQPRDLNVSEALQRAVHGHRLAEQLVGLTGVAAIARHEAEIVEVG